jgi:cytochrome c oxidase assembly protein subunit 11
MSDTADQARRNGRVALICAGVFVIMVGAAFAAVPFYRAFCQATGFNGAVKRASARSAAGSPISNRTVVVRFDTNVNGVDWRFQPVQAQQTVHLGEHKLAFFRATNLGRTTVTGRALFNVLPESAGQYFSKLECFCFRNQTLAPGQTAEFPVVYIVDPHYAIDRDTRTQTEITLSYTFFPAVAVGSSAPSEKAAAEPASGLGGRGRARL